METSRREGVAQEEHTNGGTSQTPSCLPEGLAARNLSQVLQILKPLARFSTCKPERKRRLRGSQTYAGCPVRPHVALPPQKELRKEVRRWRNTQWGHQVLLAGLTSSVPAQMRYSPEIYRTLIFGNMLYI